MTAQRRPRNHNGISAHASRAQHAPHGGHHRSDTAMALFSGALWAANLGLPPVAPKAQLLAHLAAERRLQGTPWGLRVWNPVNVSRSHAAPLLLRFTSTCFVFLELGLPGKKSSELS